jgi:protein-S-isoprenylcysteine O-methyltransferase Ste14
LIVALMPIERDGFAEAAAVCLALTYVLFGVIFLVGRQGAAAITARRDTTSKVGFVTQMVAYAIVFSISRPLFSPFVSMPKAAEALLTALAIAIGFVSIRFCYAAVRILGKQWALVARVIEGHELIMQGPYGVVRNPIYLGMFGLLLDAGLTLSRWQPLLLASVIFLIGTQIRIRAEEKILRSAFGAKFEDYARRVPAFFPRVFAKGGA